MVFELNPGRLDRRVRSHFRGTASRLILTDRSAVPIFIEYEYAHECEATAQGQAAAASLGRHAEAFRCGRAWRPAQGEV
ncbi:MAG: hypothetical protein A3K19_09880 [Lentisphaerae bacterium RIFOXYB12_FULL_65_16]|nr:MAG: hypothetical protein A3K18_00615 [Lentisphaerae bacterium RIFOXYA12_64_32]OGV91262.1 MAG: hypothetical protein A3K19_09880 [Lentisphaerae bacterium RIFOXYB12_FULL_65_16]